MLALLLAGVAASAAAVCAVPSVFPLPDSDAPCTPVDVSPVHDARCTQNSGGAGGFLLVQKSTSYNWECCSQGPTGRRRTKGGVSGPAEDLRPVSEVEAGVNFRPVRHGSRLLCPLPDGVQGGLGESKCAPKGSTPKLTRGLSSNK